MSRDTAAAGELGFPQQGGQEMLPEIRAGLRAAGPSSGDADKFFCLIGEALNRAVGWLGYLFFVEEWFSCQASHE